MIEILQIILQLSLFVFLTSFPINKHLFSNSIIIKELNIFTSLALNSLFLMIVLLIVSFLRVDITFVFFAIIFIYLIMFLRILFKKSFFCIPDELFLIFFFLFSLICIFLNTAYQFELGWDGFIWKEKANFFFNGNYLLDTSKLELSYGNYPHLGTYIWAFFWKNSFLEHEYIGRLFFNYIYIVSLFTIISNFYKIGFEKKIFIFILIFFCTFDVGLGGYQEYLIFSILSIFGTVLVCHYLKNDNNNVVYYLGFLFSGTVLPWIKNEGMVYSFFLIIIFLVYEFIFNNNKKKKNYLKYILISIVIFSLFLRNVINWVILDENLIFQANSLNLTKLNLSFETIFNNLYYIFLYLINSFFKYPIWLFNLLGLIFAAYYIKKFKIFIIFFIFLILNFSFIFAIYLTTSANVVWYLSASLDRLLLQTSGFYFAIYILIQKKIIKS